MTPTSLEVLENDCSYILDKGVMLSTKNADGLWPMSRHRSGMVMGAVQSGKTASMLGVTAMAVDAGVDIVVLLAGTRVALWRQTFDRLIDQLKPSSADHLFPSPGLVAHEAQGVGLHDWFKMSSPKARRALRDRRPILMVVMKHGHHLAAAARMLHERVFPQISGVDRPVRMLILDDEADDGSILDSVVENELDPSLDVFKQIPRHIVDLWSRREETPKTAAPNLFATYVAYTATPQANFLQADVNPLAPTSFVTALRTPFDVGLLAPRSTSYREALGLARYYTGSEIFYRRLSDVLVLSENDILGPTPTSELSIPDVPDECNDLSKGRRNWIAAATRAYLVSGAIRLMRDPEGRRLAGLAQMIFDTRNAVKLASPGPHTMLFHPSALVGDHFNAKAELLAWGHGVSIASAVDLVDGGCRSLSPHAIARDMADNPALWIRWVTSYEQSAAAVASAFDLHTAPQIPKEIYDWSWLSSFIRTEIVPYVGISVVNSDDAADARPEFDPTCTGQVWRAPRDIFTIFISGNVMARGLTLEGLVTTLFLRESHNPSADTQTQMQRWFGYRGSFIDLCRVFMTGEQHRLFAFYDQNDEALRREIIELMNLSGDRAPSPLVLEGEAFRATGKLAGVTKLPLAPGPYPFVRLVNPGSSQDPNVTLLSRLFENPSVDVISAGKVRGRIIEEPMSLIQVADLLDGLSYGGYLTDMEDQAVLRWGSLETQLGMHADVDVGLLPLFRGQRGAAQPGLRMSVCPYQIAAYLRLWSAALDRRPAGLFPTDDGSRPWSTLDLATRRLKQPRFYVGWRYGSLSMSGEDVQAAGFGHLPFSPLAMDRRIVGGRLKSTWGTRNSSGAPDAYLGDQLFDYHHHGCSPVPVSDDGIVLWRPVGAPGMVLFHLVRDHADDYPRVAVGIAVPLGGPDHFAARPRGVSGGVS